MPCLYMKTDANRFPYPFQRLFIQPADPLQQPALVDRPQLFAQDHRHMRELRRAEDDMRGDRRLAHLLGDRRHDHRFRIPVAFVILYDDHRPRAALFAPDHRRKVRIEDISSSHHHFITTTCMLCSTALISSSLRSSL